MGEVFAFESKANVIDEVLTIKSLLEEFHEKVLAMPRSVTAARQLAVIITRLDGWHKAFALSQQAAPSPSKDELMREITMVIEDLLDRKLA